MKIRWVKISFIGILLCPALLAMGQDPYYSYNEEYQNYNIANINQESTQSSDMDIDEPIPIIPPRRNSLKPIDRVKESELPTTTQEAIKLDFGMQAIAQEALNRRRTSWQHNVNSSSSEQSANFESRRSSLPNFTYPYPQPPQ